MGENAPLKILNPKISKFYPSISKFFHHWKALMKLRRSAHFKENRWSRFYKIFGQSWGYPTPTPYKGGGAYSKIFFPEQSCIEW